MKEMQRAFARQGLGQAKVVAVILRPCQWQNVPVGEGVTLSSFLAVPKDGKPVTKWSDTDEAFDNAAGAIRGLIVGGRRMAPMAEPDKNVSGVENRTGAEPRRAPVGKLFPTRVTDRDKDRYLKDAFEAAASAFKNHMEAIEDSDPRVESSFERVDSQSFIATIYLSGDKIGSCRIFTGAQHFGASICLSFDTASRNGMNEWLSLETHDDALGLKPSGMGSYGRDPAGLLDQNAAADYLWDLFLKHVQLRAR